MSNDFNAATAPAPSISTIPLFKLRVALAVLSLIAVFLPLVSMKAFGASQGFTLGDALGSIAYLIPLAFVGALVVAYHPPLREHSNLVDKISGGVLAFFLVWGIWELIQGVSQLMDLRSQLGGMPGMPRVGASDIGQILKFVSPGLGLLGLIGTFALGFIPAIKARRKA